MATIASIQSGNWSDPNTWDGGVLPAAVDTAQAITGHVVTIDQDVTVRTMGNTGSGKFVLTGSTPRNITCTTSMALAQTATSPVLEVDSDYSAEGTVINSGSLAVGNFGGAANTAIIRIVSGSSGSITINATSVSGDNWASGGGADSIQSNGGVNLTVNALSVIGTFYGNGILVTSSTGDLTVNTTAATGISGGGAIKYSGLGARTLTITGNLSSSTMNVTPYNAYNGTITISGAGVDAIINGNVPGGGSASNYSPNIGLGQINSLTINGNVTGGVSPGRGYAIDYMTGTTSADITINGDLIGGNGGSAINMIAPTNLVVNGDLRAGDGTTTLYGGGAISGTASATVDRLITIRGDVYATRNAARGASEGAVGTLPNGFAIRVGTPGQESIIYNSPVQTAITVPFMVAEGAKIRYKYGWIDESGNITDLNPVLTNLDSELDPSDVRYGVVYDAADKVGLMHIPDPSNVYVGVPVDNTVGTASIKLVDAAAVTGSQISSLSN